MTGLKDTPMSEIEAQARACRDAAQIVAGLDSAARRTLLLAMAQALEVNAGLILAGARDLAAARDKGVGSAMLDRLALDPPRLFAMAEAVREVAALPTRSAR
jgi:glutamate-5-semialdehyde dehydrogenase